MPAERPSARRARRGESEAAVTGLPAFDILVVFCIENFTRRETLLLDAARLVLLLLALPHPDRVGRDLDELVVDDVLDGLMVGEVR